MSDLFFNDEETKIFEYSNGDKIVGADPLDIHLRIESCDVDWEAELGTLQGKDEKEAARSMQVLIKSARDVFTLPELERQNDGSYIGVGGAKAFQVLMKYFLFVADLKKKPDDTLTSAMPMAQVGSVVDSPIASGADSILTSPDALLEALSRS